MTKTANLPPPAALSIVDAAASIGVCRTTVCNEIRAGRLRSFRVGTRRLIANEAVQEWIRDRERATTQAGA